MFYLAFVYILGCRHWCAGILKCLANTRNSFQSECVFFCNKSVVVYGVFVLKSGAVLGGCGSGGGLVAAGDLLGQLLLRKSSTRGLPVHNNFRMAHLNQAQIQARRLRVRDEVLAAVTDLPARPWYALQCKCGIDCLHMPFDEIPRIRLSFCLYPGEFDYYFTQNPFVPEYAFRLRWHCDTCTNEMGCGTPWLTDGPQ